jgi:hypothetical protein
MLEKYEDNYKIYLFLDKVFVSTRGLLLTGKVLNQRFLLVKLKSSLQKSYGRHHDFVNCYGISVSYMITEMFRLSLSISGPFLIHDLLPGL